MAHYSFLMYSLGIAVGGLACVAAFQKAGATTPEITKIAQSLQSPNALKVPDYLNPNPNPLQFPTKPEEVRIQGIQPITLAQALELAFRNNRDLQVAVLELKRSQASLRQSQAALLPTVSLNSSLTRSQSASNQLSAELSGDSSAD